MTAQVLRFEIDGMSCASCVGRVERLLGEADGVVSAHVNLATKTADVAVSGGGVTADGLATLATQAGYPATLMTTPTDRADKAAAAIRNIRRKFWIAAILTIPVTALAMGGHIFPALRDFADGATGWTIQFVLTTLVLLWPGADFYRKGIPGLFRGAPDMNTLVAIGTFAAWLFSTIALFIPRVLPPAAVGVYFEAAAVIVTLILLGRYMEERAKGRTGDAVRKLIGLRPKTAIVMRDGQEVSLPIDQIVVGDQIIVKPGGQFAVDGVVQSGSSAVDEAMLTGEPLPVAKAKGAQVSAGTINGNGALVIAATHVGTDTALAQIIQMVQDAQGARLPIQDLVNRVTGLFVPVVLLLAVLTVLVWLVLGPDPALGLALVAGVSVLIVACPCAMGLATPMSIMVGTGRAAEQGILFRGGDALQNLQAVDAIAFDKTRTLTEGRPTLTGLQTADGFDADTVLTLAASLEAQSEHPIAQAVVMAAADKGIHPLAVSDFAAVTGMGITGQVGGQSVRIGAERFMPEGAALTLDAAFDAGGRSVFYIAIDGVLAGALAVSDPVRADAAGMVSALKSMGLRVALITGDTQSAADALAEKVGINDVVAGVLPAGKSDALDRLAAGGKVAFVGDGINDAPALAKADVGIAIGTGTDVAIEAADVVLMAHDLMAVTRAVQISRATLRNIKQNLFWAFAYNAALIPVAAGLLHPVWGVLLSPMLAAGAMALSSVFVVTNALRLRRA